MGDVLQIYHGSNHIVGQPVFGKGKPYNDYGRGFYCTESIEMAKEWACSEKSDGYANAYRINTKGLNILNLNDYSILNWLAVLLVNRKFDVSLPIARAAREYIIKNFGIDTTLYDIIVGYRADDSYFSFAQDFISNSISVEKLKVAMHLGELGEQVVLISEKAFERVEFIKEKTEFADSSIYYPKKARRDEMARHQYLNVERKEIDFNGLYVRDIMQRGLKNEDIQ